jgi:integrase
VATPIKHRGKWRIRWIDADGQRRSEVYENFTDAKRALRARQVEADEVRAGTRAKRPEARTFAELCDHWLETRGATKRSAKDDKSICKRLREFLGDDRLLGEIGVEDADAYLDEHDDLSPKTLANHLTLLITMMNYAASFREPWILKVPRFKKPKIAALGRNYSYLRTREEIDRFLRAAKEEGDAIHMLYAAAITTGLRAGELAGLEWQDVNFDTRLIMVQRSFAGPTKSGHARPVPILDGLLSTLREWRMRHPGRLVFTNRDGRMLDKSARAFQEVLHRVLDRAAFPSETKPNGRVRRYVTFHGLRHTFASHWMMNGGDVFKLQQILGHQSMTMTLRYAHLAPHAFADDYGRLGPPHAIESATIAALPTHSA